MQTETEPIYLHDGYARYRLLQWLPEGTRYPVVPAIVALPDGQVLYRQAPWYVCTRMSPDGCRWCGRG